MSKEYQVVMANQFFKNEIPEEYQHHLNEAIESRKEKNYKSGKTEKLKIHYGNRLGLLYLSNGVLKTAISDGYLSLLSISKDKFGKWEIDGKCYIIVKIKNGEIVGIPDSMAYRAVKSSHDYFELNETF